MLVKFNQKVYLFPRIFEKGQTYDVDITVLEACYPCCEVVKEPEEKAEKTWPLELNTERRAFFPNDGYGRLNRLVRKYFTFDNSNLYIYFTTPYIFGVIPKEILYNKKIILYTMFEGSKLPVGWIDSLAKYAKAIITPSEFCGKLYRQEERLKDIPVYVTPLFTEHFENLKPEPDETFWFGMENAFIQGKQKGWDLVIEAFEELNLPNAKLLLKGRQAHYAYIDTCWFERTKKNPNIEVVVEDYSDQQMIDLFYKKIDCFVYPSRGEGFGLPPLQAMAFGIPTILTAGHGMKEFSKFGVPVKIKNKAFPAYYVNRVWDSTQGIKWVEPSLADLKKKMKFVYNNFYSQKKRAVRNIDKIKNLYSIDVFARNLTTVISHFKANYENMLDS